MNRDSNRAKSSSSGPTGPRLGRRRQTILSSRPMKGVSTTTVARRKRVFSRAMFMEERTVSRKEKWTAALTA